MKLTDQSLKQIMFLIFFFVLTFFAIQHINVVWKGFITIFQYLFPFILGLCIAFVLNVFMKKIEEKWLSKTKIKNKRATALILTLFLLFGFIIFLCFLIIPELIKTISLLINQLPRYIMIIQDWLNSTFSLNLKATDLELETIKDSALSFFQSNSSYIIGTTVSITGKIIGTIANIAIAIVFACYILSQKETLAHNLKKFLIAFFPKKRVSEFYQISKLSQTIFSNFITGQILEAFIIGILCLIGMLILQIPYASMISVLVGFTALIPVLGAFIGTAIGVLLILTISPIKAIIFVIFIIVLQQIDGNFIYPKVVGKSVGLPSIWVFLAITLGGSIFGIIGMLISVPICSIVYSILKIKIQNNLIKKKIEV